MLMHVPDWDCTRKQRPRTVAPFGDNAGTDVPKSTYSQHFSNRMAVPVMQPIRPPLAYPWNEHKTGPKGQASRSTQQDSFQPPLRSQQLASCKPLTEYKPTDWQTPITTTSSAAYARYANVKRTLPCYPARREEEDFRFTARPTSLDSYQPVPSGFRPPEPVYPVSAGAFGGGEAKIPETTFRASYVKHSVRPYVKALKPTEAMDQNLS